MEAQTTKTSEIEKMLKAPRFQKTLALLAEQKGESLASVSKEAEEYLKELYTEHRSMSNMILMEAAEYILGRGYDKTIDVNPDEIKQLAKLMRKHPVAFVLTH